MNEIEKAIKLLEKCREEIQNCYGKDTELTIKITNFTENYNGGWVSVSERLPEICGLNALLTIENVFNQRQVIRGFTGYMENGKLEFHTHDIGVNLHNWSVIAWQPLPEPFKGVENE
jgi:hypothetical protein